NRDVLDGNCHHDTLDLGRGLQNVESPPEEGPRPHADVLFLPAHADTVSARRDHDPNVRSGHAGPGHRRPGASSSARRVKIMRPAAVWSTVLTMTLTVWPMWRRPCSTTTIVPSSRYATPWPASFPSRRTWARSISPARPAGRQ